MRLLVLGAAVFCFVVGMTALNAVSLAPLTHHMSTHMLLMNAVAPLAALALSIGDRPPSCVLRSPLSLAIATVVQLAVLWGSHTPFVLTFATQTPAAHLILQGMLFAVALWFWRSVLAQHNSDCWRALVALLITGKLFCLLAALLVFAPRHLYPGVAHAHAVVEPATPELSDQQLAGLLMVAACPLTYVIAAIVIAARWLREIAEDRSAVPIRSEPWS